MDYDVCVYFYMYIYAQVCIFYTCTCMYVKKSFRTLHAFVKYYSNNHCYC